jgi:hypothetical protein
MKRTERLNIAIHEAAHAAAALSLGRRFRAVEAFQDMNRPEVTTSWVSKGTYMGRFWPEDSLIFWAEIPDATLISMAGPAATKRLNHDSWSSPFWGSGQSDYTQAIGQVAELPRVSDPGGYAEPFLRQATKLVSLHWPMILRAAGELDRRGVLTYEETVAIWSAYFWVPSKTQLCRATVFLRATVFRGIGPKYRDSTDCTDFLNRSKVIDSIAYI